MPVVTLSDREATDVTSLLDRVFFPGPFRTSFICVFYFVHAD